MKLIKKISNYFRKPVKDYKSKFDNYDIRCDILLGSCPSVNHKYMRDTLDHIIIRFEYGDSMISQLNQFIDTCLNYNISVFIYRDKNMLCIASNCNNLFDVISSDYYNENQFSTMLMAEMESYKENRDLYDFDNTPSFEYVQNKHESIIRRFNYVDKYPYIEILGYTYIPDIPYYLNCIWLQIDYETLSELFHVTSIGYLINGDHLIVKINLSEFINFISSSDSDSSNLNNDGNDEITTEENYQYSTVSSLDIIKRILNSNQKYFEHIPFTFNNNISSDNIDEDEEEEEISSEEFFNAVVDEILK